MAATVVRVLAFAGAAPFVANGAGLDRTGANHTPPGSWKEDESATRSANLLAEMAYELTGRVMPATPALPFPNSTGVAKAFAKGSTGRQRPIVVLKMARTGSTWFRDQLLATRFWPYVRAEASNDHDWCRHHISPTPGKCEKLISDVMAYMEPSAGGVTLNPFKFDCTTPHVGGCFEGLWKNLSQAKPIVVVLVRKNTVLQAAARLRAQGIEKAGLCRLGFHLEHCPAEAVNFRVRAEPRLLLQQAKTNRVQSESLAEIGRRLTPPHTRIMRVHTEDFFNYKTGTFNVPHRVWEFLAPNESTTPWMQSEATPIIRGVAEKKGHKGVDANASTMLMSNLQTMLDSVHQAVDFAVGIDRTLERLRARSKAAADSEAPAEPALLRNYISNFKEVRHYFKKYAPGMLPMVDAVDGST